MDAGEYLYYMGAFMTCTVWMLITSYRDVPKLYLMRSVQESVFMLFCKMEAVFQVRSTARHDTTAPPLFYRFVSWPSASATNHHH